jgi:hypothetical protein
LIEKDSFWWDFPGLSFALNPVSSKQNPYFKGVSSLFKKKFHVAPQLQKESTSGGIVFRSRTT